MKKINYMFLMLLAFIGLSAPVHAAEPTDAATYLAGLSYEQLQPELSAFDSKDQARMYSFAFNTDATPIGYTEWCLYKNGITEEDRNAKNEFFTNDCESFSSEDTTINAIDGDYSAIKTTCVAKGSITNIKGEATDSSVKFSIKEGFGVTPNFALGINVNDEGNEGNLYINEDNAAHEYEYTLSDKAKENKNKDKDDNNKDDKSSKDKDSKNDKKSSKKKSNKDDSMSVLTFSLIIGASVSVISLIALIIVYVLRRKKIKKSNKPQIGRF